MALLGGRGGARNTKEVAFMAEKKGMSIVKKMMIALVGGLAVGTAFMFLRESLVASGQNELWNTINNLLFQDIRSPQGVKALGLFFIIGQLFMNGLMMAIVPLVLVSIALSMCSISDAAKLGRVAVKTLITFFGFYACGCAIAAVFAYTVKGFGWFNVVLPYVSTDVAKIAPYNPLGVIINSMPSNMFASMSTNTQVLCVVVIGVITGICMNKLGDKALPLKNVLRSVSDIINMWLTFLINKVGPVAIFCLITRTFAAYGIGYVKPALAYMGTAIFTLFFVLFIMYPIGIFVTTGLNPVPFIRKMTKVGIFGFAVNSSAATLPINTTTNLNELGCSEDITSFVLPLGMTINMNGTSIMHVIAVTFIATSAGITVTPATLAVAGILSICAAAGTPAIPVAGTTMISTVLLGLGFNSEACLIGYALVLALNRPVEMSLLTLNVIGDAATNLIVNAKEGTLKKDVYYSK